MKRRILSIITALALCLNLCPTWAFAVEGEPDTGLCDHHPEHTEDCGYAAPTEGQPCTHEHTDECCIEETLCIHVHDESCYSDGLLPGEEEEKEADRCAHECTVDSGCVTLVTDCQHTHDEECGYVEADPGQPCGYECRLCPIEDLIDDLPEKVTEDNRMDVEAQLQEILSLYTALDEDEQEQIDLIPCLELFETLDEAASAMPLADTFTMNASITINSGNVSQYNNKTLTGASSGYTLTIDGTTVNLTISGLNFTGGTGGTIVLQNKATLNLTLQGSNTLASSGTTAGITVPEGCSLTINGTDTDFLTVSGGIGGAGIGANYYAGSDGGTNPNTVGTITINGGNITATGSSGGAGIGGTTGCTTGHVVINGGNINATAIHAAAYAGATGIGGGISGYLESIVINGGTVTAKGSGGGAGIGAGYWDSNNAAQSSCGDIQIKGGTVQDTVIGFATESASSDNGSITIEENADLLGCTVRPLPENCSSCSLHITIYDEGISGDMDARVTISGHHNQVVEAKLKKIAEYCGKITIDSIILPRTVADSTLPVMVTAGGKTWTGTATAGERKTLTIGSPIQPATAVFDLSYGDITFEPNGDNVQVKYTDEGGEKTYLLTDLSTVYEVTQSGADMVTTNRLTIKSPVHVRVKNLNMHNNGGEYSPIEIGGKVTLELSGNNKVESTYGAQYREGKAAIHVPGGVELTLTGTGSLEAVYNNSKVKFGSAGIGANKDETSGTIIIQSGTITAQGRVGAAGIGSCNREAGPVIITGGTVTATSTSTGAGIGGGATNKGTVTISGGTVTASSKSGTSIGNGAGGNGSSVTITGGSIKASSVSNPKNDNGVGVDRVEITLDGVGDGVPVTSENGIAGYGCNDVYTRDNGKLYFYLPNGERPTITVGGVDYVPESDGSTKYVVDFRVSFNDYPLTKEYDGKPMQKPAAGQVTSNGNNLTFAWYQDGAALSGNPINAGSYVLRVSSDKGSKDFDVKITKRPLTITAQDQTIDYKKTIAQDAYTVSGLAVGDEVGSISLAASQTAPGTYTGAITVSSAQIMRDSADVTANYGITYQPGDLTINKIAITVNGWPTASAITYGQALSDSSLTGGDANGTFAWKDGTAKPGAGTAEFEVVFTPTDTNYESVSKKVSVTVNKAPLTVTGATATDKNYDGTANVTVTAVTLTGVVNIDDVSIDTENLTGTVSSANAGTYTEVTLPELTLTGTQAGNYTLTQPTGYVPTNVTISPAAITVTPDRGIQKEYGAADPELTYRITVGQLYGTDALTGALVRNAGENVGEYPITAGNLTAGSNYALIVTSDVKFTITGLSLANASVTLDSNRFLYDGAAKTPAVTVKKGESTVDPGEYDISYSNTNGGSGDHTHAGTVTVTVTAKAGGNYTGSCSTDFTIDKKTLTPAITGTTTKVYDGTTDTPNDLSITLTGIVNGDTVTAAASCAYDSADAGENKTITASGITLDGADKENYTLSDTSATIKGTITKAVVTIIWGNPAQTVTYTGTSAAVIAPTVTAENGVTVSENPQYSYAAGSGVTFTPGLPVNAGTYTVRASITGSGNLSAAQADMTLTIDKAPLTVSGAAAAPKTYNGNTDADVSGVTFTGLVNGETLSPGTDYTAAGTFDTAEVGTGKHVAVTVALTDTAAANNYVLTGSSVTVTSEIMPISIAAAMVTLSTDTFTYTGERQAPTVTVTLEGAALTEGTDYALSFSSDCIHAGEITITVAGKNHYGGAASGKYTIRPATLTPSLTGTTAKTYDGGTAAPDGLSVSLSGILKADDVTAKAVSITYDTAGVGGNKTITASGITLNGTAADNYILSAAAATIPGEITQADAPTAADGTMIVSNDLERIYSYTLSQLLPVLNGGQTFGTVSYTLGTVSLGDYYDNGAAISDETLSLPVRAVETDEEKVIGTVQITISSTNFKDMPATITVSSVERIVPVGAPTASPDTITYGQSISEVTLSGQMSDGTNPIEGTLTWNDPSATPDAGTYQTPWTFTPVDTVRYAPTTGTVGITVNKATPNLTLTPSPATLPNGGTVTLTLSGVPAGGSAAVTCSDENITVTKGSGDTWTAEIPAGGASYTFTASYAGDGNHEAVSASCTVSVEKLTPELALTAAPEVLTSGGKVTLTLTGLPENGAADVTCSDAGVSVTQEREGVWTAILPNENAVYRFTASFAGNDSCHPASAECTVTTKQVVILPDPPAGNEDEQFQIVMEPGISEVPAGITANRPELNSPAKLEIAMKTEISKVTSGIPEENTSVFDVTLMVSTDGGKTWEPADQKNFPSDGLTVTLPYPDGTDSSFRFTVVHMFTSTAFGKRPGDTEIFTPDQVKNMAQGLQVVVTGMSPISVGWEEPETPVEPSKPSKPSGGGAIHPTSGSAYAVTVEDSAHGKVSASAKRAESGDTVTLTVKPDEGYALDTLTVTDSRGNELRLTERNGKFTFTMPARAVTVEAEFVRSGATAPEESDGHANCPSRAFYDLDTGEWYHEAVDFVLESGVMNGTNNGFAPSAPLSRAMLAQILWSHAGKPSAAESRTFSDVPENEWYSEAIGWAASAEVVGGYTDGRFGPSDNVTREQFAVMLWRYAGSPAGAAALNFRDTEQISSYALEALRWAVGEGILSGKSGNRLDPQGAATRAETAQMLYNFLNNE